MIADMRPGLREFIVENLHLAAVYVDTARQYAEIGDDNALAHAIDRLVSYVATVAQSTDDVLRENQSEKRERAT